MVLIKGSIKQVRLAFAGEYATGTTTVAKAARTRIGFIPYENSGKFARKIASELGMSIREFAKFADEHPERNFDKSIDDAMKHAGKENENGIFEGRLSGPFIDDALCVLFTCEREERGRRRHAQLLHNDPSFKKTFEQVLEEEDLRAETDRKRYIDVYGESIIWTPDMYHLVVDTTGKQANEVVDKIFECYNTWNEEGRVPGPLKKAVGKEYVPGSQILALV